jgi:hypothetical protein
MFTPHYPANGTGSGITVLTGGHLTATNTTFGWDTLILKPGSAGLLAVDSLATQLAIDSAATFSITGNDFSSTNARVVASGDPSATIHLEHNYWGSAPISPKIKDHLTDPTRPTVNYNPVQPTISPRGAAATAVANNASAIFSAADQTVTLTANVTSGAVKVPEGKVMFTIVDGINMIGQPVIVDVANGVATAKSYPLPGGTAAGTYTIQAIYLGTANYLGYSYTSNSLTVASRATNTAVSSSANPSVFGQTIILTATVSPVSPGIGTPTGTVTFMDGTTPLGKATLSGGVATLPTSMLTVVPNSITAVYSSDSNFTTSTSTALTQTVNQDSTTTILFSSAPQGSVYSQVVVFTASVIANSPGAGTPTGTVTFMDGTTPLGPAVKLSGGTATFYTSNLSVVTHSITVVYNGDTNFKTSTSKSVSLTVSKDGTTQDPPISSVNPSVVGQTVVFTAVMIAASPGSATPTGTVTFMDGATTLGKVTLSGGTATFATSKLAVGTHPITVVYGGDTNFIGTTSKVLNQIVNGSSSPAYVGTTGQSGGVDATVTDSVGAINQGTAASKDLGGTSLISAPATSGTSSQQATQTTILETARTGAYGHPSRHSAKPHRPNINGGPLALSQSAHKQQPRSHQPVRVADKQAHSRARLAVAIDKRAAVTTAEA